MKQKTRHLCKEGNYFAVRACRATYSPNVPRGEPISDFSRHHHCSKEANCLYLPITRPWRKYLAAQWPPSRKEASSTHLSYRFVAPSSLWIPLAQAPVKMCAHYWKLQPLSQDEELVMSTPVTCQHGNGVLKFESVILNP